MKMPEQYGRLQVLPGGGKTTCFLYSKNNQPPEEFKIPSAKVGLLGLHFKESSRSRRNPHEFIIENETRFKLIVEFLRRYQL